MDWQKDGLCREAREDADWFARRNSPAARTAKRWCGVCPVRDACLVFSLTEPGILGDGLLGIWGGTDERERNWLREPDFADLLEEAMTELIEGERGVA